MKFAHIAALGALLSLSACAMDAGPVTPVAPVAARVTNATGKTIARIEYRACDDGGGPWAALDVGAMPSGAVRSFQLPASCVNLNAYYEDGRLAGSQSGVRRDYPFQWTLS